MTRCIVYACLAGSIVLAGCNLLQKRDSASATAGSNRSDDTAMENLSDDTYAVLFREGIRLEPVGNADKHAYVVFSRDSLTAEFCLPSESVCWTMCCGAPDSHRRIWRGSADTCMEMQYIDGCWTVRHGANIYRQMRGDSDDIAGAWMEEHYTGILPAADCPGIRYDLSIRHRVNSGDGIFLLRQTYLEADRGRDVTFTCMGTRNTQRGIPGDNNATVWQFVPDNDDRVYNFVYDANEQTLTLLCDNFEPIDSKLNYTIRKVCDGRIYTDKTREDRHGCCHHEHHRNWHRR